MARRSTKACKVIFCTWIPEDNDLFGYLKKLPGQDSSKILKRFVVAGNSIPLEFACVPEHGGQINGKLEERILYMDLNDSFEKTIIETYSNSISPQIYMRAIAIAGWNLFRGVIPFGASARSTGNLTAVKGKTFEKGPLPQIVDPLPPELDENRNGPPKDDSYDLLRGLIG